MSRIVVANKLNLGKETIGYRFDIMEGLNRLVSFDIAEDYAKYFLKMVGKERIRKGLVIQGKVQNNMFITGNEENVIEVTNGTQAKELLDKYFFTTDKEINEILSGVNKSKVDLIKGKIEKLEVEKYHFADCVEIRKEFIKLVKSVNGVRADLNILEDMDKNSGEFKFSIKVANVVDLFKCIYNITKLDEGNRVTFKGYIGNTRDIVNLSANGSLDDFMKDVSSKVDFSVVNSMEGELSNNKKSGYFISFVDTFVIESCLSIPGYNELENFDRNYLLEKYGLHEK